MLTEDYCSQKVTKLLKEKGFKIKQYYNSLIDMWQDVRERAAIAAMQGAMNFFGSIDYNRDTIARLAVEQADALIEQLKKK